MSFEPWDGRWEAIKLKQLGEPGGRDVPTWPQVWRRQQREVVAASLVCPNRPCFWSFPCHLTASQTLLQLQFSISTEVFPPLGQRQSWGPIGVIVTHAGMGCPCSVTLLRGGKRRRLP